MAEPRKLTPAEEARLAQVRDQFKQKQAISNSLNSIKYRIGVNRNTYNIDGLKSVSLK